MNPNLSPLAASATVELRSALTEPVVLARGLIRMTGLFVAIDSLYLGYSMACAFKMYSVTGALALLAAQYVVALAGYFLAFSLLNSPAVAASGLLRVGLLVTLALTGAAGVVGLMSMKAALVLLASAGFGRGLSYASRTWLEMHHTKSAEREAYLSKVQAITTLAKLVGPLLVSAMLLALHADSAVLYVGVAVVGLLALLAVGNPLDAVAAPRPGPLRPLAVLFTADYWQAAPFYALEGAGASLRQALFVSGVIAVVGSLSAFGAVDATASLLSAGIMYALARNPLTGPSERRLAVGMGLIGVSWIALLGALHWPVLLGAFIALQAAANPLVSAQKSSLVLKGCSLPGTPAQDNILARELLLTAARLPALGLAAVLAWECHNKVGAVTAVVVGMMLLMPFEYIYARKLATR